MTDPSDQIPIAEYYRGVGIHIDNPRERIDRVIRPEIDAVFDLEDAEALFKYACDGYKSPEARIFAGAKVMAMFESSAEHRWVRPKGVTREAVRAAVAGLSSLKWRDPWFYGCILCSGPPGRPDPPRRETPLPDRWEPRR